MPLTQNEVRELARILDERALAKGIQEKRESCSMSLDELERLDALVRKRKREARTERLQLRRRMKIVTGDALSPGAMKLARAYDAATPDQRRCMDAVAAVAFVMSGQGIPNIAG